MNGKASTKKKKTKMNVKAKCGRVLHQAYGEWRQLLLLVGSWNISGARSNLDPNFDPFFYHINTI